MSLATTDLSDAHPTAVQAADPIFRDYGGRRAFHGPITTLKLFEDNALVRSALETPGEGRVLVVDGGGSLRCALLGDQLAELAVRHAWAGVVVYGCIRDSEAIGLLPLGVKALSIAFLWATIGSTAAFATGNLAVRIVLLVVAAGVTAHILTVPTPRRTGPTGMPGGDHGEEAP